MYNYEKKFNSKILSKEFSDTVISEKVIRYTYLTMYFTTEIQKLVLVILIHNLIISFYKKFDVIKLMQSR